jgi:Ca2+-binding RTX toxin-like protein
MSINVVGQVFFGTHTADHLTPGFGDDAYIMTADDFVTDTIDGGGGSDTVDYSRQQDGVGVTVTLTDPLNARGASGGTVVAEFPIDILNPATGKYVTIEHDQVVANLTNIENAVGTNNNDVLTGNSGNNILTGGGGHDVLTGGDGNDRFVFNHQSDSPAGPFLSLDSFDRITDFTPGEDHIDLHGLVNETAGHAPLTLVDGPFTGVAGQVVEAFMSNGTTQGTGFLVAADLNGDRAPDFEIFVHVTEPHVRLQASDFILHS